MGIVDPLSSSHFRLTGVPANPRTRSARGRGFTLLEVLLVLALIGLLSAVLVTGGSRLLATQSSSPDDVFWAAVQEARKMALRTEGDVVMQFVDDHEKGKAFTVTSNGATKTFPIPKAGDLEVTFLSQQKGGTIIMIAGTVVETQKVASVTFYSDGTCSPFRVQFYRDGAVHLASIDPWTCAQMLTTDDSSGASHS